MPSQDGFGRGPAHCLDSQLGLHAQGSCRFLDIRSTFLAQDLSKQVENGRMSILDPFQVIFDVFGPAVKSGLGQNLALTPQTKPADSKAFFLGPILELF